MLWANVAYIQVIPALDLLDALADVFEAISCLF